MTDVKKIQTAPASYGRKRAIAATETSERAADTKQRILDVAERLFAEKGFAATSLRAITAQAGVNLASVNYHFRSKEALLHAVFDRRIGPINRKRLELLELFEAEAGGKGPPLEKVIEAFLTPVLLHAKNSGDAGGGFKRLLGRLYAEPGEEAALVINRQFGTIRQRFTAAFARALPDLSQEETYWRLHFMIGVMANVLTGRQRLYFISEGLCNPDDLEVVLRRMVIFLAAGFRAPAPNLQRKEAWKGQPQ